MKKIFLALAMTLTVGSLATVFATNTTLNTTTKSGTTDVNYILGDRYTITIPQAFELNDEPNDPISQTLSASDVFIANKTKLQVVIKGANGTDTEWLIKDVSDQNNTFEYKVNSGDFVTGTALNSGDVALEILAGDTDGGSSTLSFDLAQTVVKAGTYKDTLTFTSSIVAQ